jgi:uracil-DNA glycosylase
MADGMTAVERSAALRRMGISEWLPRHDDAAVLLLAESHAAESLPSGVEAPTANPMPRVSHNAVAAAQIEPQASLSVATRPAPSGQANVPAIAAIAEAASTNAPALRGRLLVSQSGAALLVLAQAEKNARDPLLNPQTAQGALLNAMLAQLSVPANIAMLGVERGEPIAVPATILVLGERSARLLLGNDIAAPLRGRVHLFGQSRVVVSYHPDELRQNGSLKRLAWEDLRLLSGLLASAGSAEAGRR